KQMSMYKYLILLSCYLLTAQTHAMPLVGESPWRDTGLKWNDLRRYINDDNCRQNGQRFSACVEAVNLLYHSFGRRGRFEPDWSSRQMHWSEMIDDKGLNEPATSEDF